MCAVIYWPDVTACDREIHCQEMSVFKNTQLVAFLMGRLFKSNNWAMWNEISFLHKKPS